MVSDYGDFLRATKSGEQQDKQARDIARVKLTSPNHKHLVTI